MKTGTNVLACAALLAAAGQANAEFISHFDAFVPDADLVGVDGWHGWDNVASAAGVVSDDIAYEGPNSLLVTGYTDAVQTYTGATAGTWMLEAKQYIASGQSGLSYFIVMNRYTPGANGDSAAWSAQVKFDLASGLLSDDFRGGSLPIAFNQWADLRLEIDLDADTVNTFYNDAHLSSGSWTRSGSSSLAIAAIDLYSGDANATYYDNVSLSPDVPSPGVPGAAALAIAGLCARLRRHV